jgi:putative transposase
MTARLSHADEAFRSRDRSGFESASLLIDPSDEPLRRGGSTTGVLCVWGICVAGRKVLLTRSTAHSESSDSGLEVLRDLVKRSLPTPVTMTTEGAPGFIQAIDAMWPRALRIRCWFHTMQHLRQKVPPQAWPAFKAVIADMRDAPTVEAGQRRQQALLAQSHDKFPEAYRCLEDDAEARLNHLKVPVRHRQ